MIDLNFIVLIAAIFLVAMVLLSALNIFREYERGVVFTLGRFGGIKGPGLVVIVPFVQRVVRMDLRTVVLDVPTQDIITRDNVSARVNAVVYFRVIDPGKGLIQVEDYLKATSQLAQTTLRSVLGKHELDAILAERDRLNQDIQAILDAQTDAWGIKVATVEIKQVELGENMVRAIARQAEAERNRRAKVINAEGEQQAAARLVDAANELMAQPGAFQLRYISALQEIANERSSTIILPLPVELLELLRARGETTKKPQERRTPPPEASA